MKTEQTQEVENYKSPFQKMREHLINLGVNDPFIRMAVSDLLSELLMEKWNEGFKKASEIHRGMLNQYINTQTP